MPIPTKDDVLFGRGPIVNMHPGNTRFRATIAEQATMYAKLETLRDKEEQALKVVHGITSRGGRFLRRVDIRGTFPSGASDKDTSLEEHLLESVSGWEEVDSRAALAKVKQTFRDHIVRLESKAKKLSGKTKIKKHATAFTAPETKAAPEEHGAVTALPYKLQLQLIRQDESQKRLQEMAKSMARPSGYMRQPTPQVSATSIDLDALRTLRTLDDLVGERRFTNASRTVLPYPTSNLVDSTQDRFTSSSPLRYLSDRDLLDLYAPTQRAPVVRPRYPPLGSQEIRPVVNTQILPLLGAPLPMRRLATPNDTVRMLKQSLHRLQGNMQYEPPMSLAARLLAQMTNGKKDPPAPTVADLMRGQRHPSKRSGASAFAA